MMFFLFISLLALGALFNVSKATCLSGWTLYNNNCYLFHIPYSGNSWTTCHSACLALNAGMLCIQNAAQNAWVYSNTQNYHAWIGATDMPNKGSRQYTWVDGCVSTYLNWYSGEPNNANNNEDYIAMFPTPYGGGWNDASNTNAERSFWWGYNAEFICSCQINVNSVTE